MMADKRADGVITAGALQALLDERNNRRIHDNNKAKMGTTRKAIRDMSTALKQSPIQVPT